MRHFLVAASLFLFVFSGRLSAQDLLQGKVTGNFQLDAQIYKADSAIGASEVKEKLLSNAFANLLYTQGNFTAGLRFESYINPILGYDSRYAGTGVPYWFAGWEKESFGITVGHFYEQFGSGMTLRSYEERNLGYDNAIKGARFVFRPYKGITLKALIGTQRFFWETGPGIVRGLDGDLFLNDIFKFSNLNMPSITIGGSFVSKYEPSAQIIVGGDNILILPENVAAIAGRFNINHRGFILDGEYAYKYNDPSAVNRFIYKAGRGMLLQATYSQKGFGVILSGKVTDNMSFKSKRTEKGSVLDINYLPALTRQHAYALAAMYPYATQPNGEMAIQGQVNYKIPKSTLLGGKYGTDIAVNFSRVTSLKKDSIAGHAMGESGTLGYTTKYFAFGDELYFRDFNLEIQHKFNSNIKALLTFVNLKYNIDVIEGHPGEEMVNANIFIGDVTYKFNQRNAIKVEAQHLNTRQDEGNWAQLMLEYTIAPTWFATVIDQYNYGNNDKDRRFHYPTLAVGYTQGASRLAISYGKQREGILCVGGVCRNVPASNGLTITLTSSF